MSRHSVLPPPMPLRRTYGTSFLALALLAACAGESGEDAGAGAAAPRVWRTATGANLVLIVLDTARADRLVDEAGMVITPELARLAADGVVFTRCYSHASMTLPAHVSLFTSRMPYETGVLTNESPMPPELPGLVGELRGAGYATGACTSIGAIGKRNVLRDFEHVEEGEWGLSFAENTWPRVDTMLETLSGDPPFFLFAHYSDPHHPYRAHGLADRSAEVFLDGLSQGEVNTSMAETWEATVTLEPGIHRVEVRSDEDFAVRDFTPWVRGQLLDWEFEVGAPYEPLRRAVLRFENPQRVPHVVQLRVFLEDIPRPAMVTRRYEGEIAYADRYIGELLDELRTRELYDSSLIVFTSDHGEGLGEHDWWVHAENVYDEQIHVPLIVKLPAGLDPAGLRANADSLVRHVDVTATIVDVLGLPGLPEMKGVSLRQPGDRVLVAQTHKPIAERDLVALRDERFKMIYDVDADSFEMYDVALDPEELEDVFAELGDQRPDWPSRLRELAHEALATPQGEVDPALRKLLDNLGY